jgi:hypothetical protein
MIFIRLYYQGESVHRIRISGHGDDVLGERACYGVSILSRTLLHVVGIEDRYPKELQYGNFDVTLDSRRKTQQAARHTITGYRMIAKYASVHVRIRKIEVPGDGN